MSTSSTLPLPSVVYTRDEMVDRTVCPWQSQGRNVPARPDSVVASNGRPMPRPTEPGGVARIFRVPGPAKAPDTRPANGGTVADNRPGNGNGAANGNGGRDGNDPKGNNGNNGNGQAEVQQQGKLERPAPAQPAEPKPQPEKPDAKPENKGMRGVMDHIRAKADSADAKDRQAKP